MLNWVFALLIIFAGFIFWFYKSIFPVIIRKKAQRDLQKIVFPDGENQKTEVMKAFHEFTNNRFSNDQVLDYFTKIKGLQNFNFYKNYGFWTKRYLLRPTDIKLNYFEQVSFYEVFLNYPRALKEEKNSKGTQNSHTAILNRNELDSKSLSLLKKEFA